MSSRVEHSFSNPFAALALERASERRDDVEWLAIHHQQPATRFILLRPDGQALVNSEQNRLLLLDGLQRKQFLPQLAASFLGELAATNYFLLNTEAELASFVADRLGGNFLDLRRAGIAWPAFESGLFAYARALAHWQTNSRFCGRCGAAIYWGSAGHKGCCSNQACASVYFPRIDPAIIAIVTYQDTCLLARQPDWPERRYSTLAGFVEPGETLEDAVRREVMEEAGVRIQSCEYHSSQPWPFPASLMLAFTAHAQNPDLILGPELADARWFTASQIAQGVTTGELVLSSPLSVSYRLIEHWLRTSAGLELSQLQLG